MDLLIIENSFFHVLIWLQIYKEPIQIIMSMFGIGGGAYGLYLLHHRTAAAIDNARAALAASEAATAQAQTAVARHESQTLADRERRFGETFTRANEQLASKEDFARLGAIYTLERLSHESEHYYWPTMEILSAYIRRRMALPEPDEQAPTDDVLRISQECSAIFSVLGRRNAHFLETLQPGKDHLISLAGTDLRAVNFQQRLNLARINFKYADFSHSTFAECNLGNSWLVESKLFGCDFERKCSLQNSFMHKADLRQADLSGVDLKQAVLVDAKLENAFIGGVDLSEVIGLKQKQINTAIGDSKTCLPPDINRPETWPDLADNDEWSQRRFGGFA